MDPTSRQTSNMYAPMRGNKGRKKLNGEKAIIAAKFDDCCNNLHRFYFSCLSMKEANPGIDSEYAGDLLALLKTWGEDVGACDYSLDRKLRLSSDLRDQIVDLLTDLQADIQSGLDCLETMQSNPQTIREEGFSSEEDEIGPNDDSEDPKLDGPLENLLQILDDAGLTIEQLKLLGPELHNAHPTDLDRQSCSTSMSGDTDDSAEVNLTRAMFPYASPALIDRLAHANWKRRHALRMLQDRRSSSLYKYGKGRSGYKKAARRDVAVDAFNFQQPELRTESNIKQSSFLTLTGALGEARRPTQSIQPSTAPPSTISPSIFSGRPGLSRVDSQSSMSMSIAFPKLDAAEEEHMIRGSEYKRLQVPPPPRPLEDKKPFVCPVCDFEINLSSEIKTPEDWEQHVFEDLMAYLCTYDECLWAKRTYGARDDWYVHELHTHRITKVWVCEDCKEEYVNKNGLIQHLISAHASDFTPAEASRVVSLLRPTHSRKPLKSQRCPLCPSPLEPKQVKEHVADHLEQLALTSVNGDDSTEEGESDEIMSQSADDNMSDRGTKLAILQAFAQEQVQNISKNVRHAEITEAEDFRYDSDEEGFRDSASETSGQQGVTRNWRVRELMEGRQTATAGRETFGKAMYTFPKSQSSHSATGAPATLPLLHTRAFPRNDDFRGREKELANMYKILSEPGRVYVLSAEGGMGKTAIAVQFTYLFEQSFHYIFWVQAETTVGALETFNQIALQLKLAPSGTDQNTLTRLGREFLENVKDKKWLLVFDNVEKWEDIDIFTPSKTSATNGGILITTRHQALTAPSRPVNYYRKTLEELTTDEGRELLIHGLPQELRPEVSSIRDPEFKVAGDIASLAGLPLAIIYIAGYMKAMNCKPSEFWSYWDSWWLENRQVVKSDEQGTGKGKLDSIMQMSVGDLGPDALKILRIMAFLDSDGVQKELLLLAAGQRGPTYLQPYRFRIILKELVSKHFVEEKKHENKEFYVVHRALQSRLLHELHSKTRQREELFKIAFDLVRAKLPRPSLDSNESQKWNQFKEYMPHVASLQRVYSDPLSVVALTPFVGLAELFRDGGVLLWQRYISNDAMKLLTSAEKILDELEGDHDHLRAEIHITMNLLLQYLGIIRRKESRERLNKILQFRKKMMAKSKEANTVTENDRVLLINAFADYANSMLQFNDYEAAEPIYNSCYQRYLKLSSEEESPFAFAKLNHHMAYCKMYRRDFAEAISLAQKAVMLVSQLNDRLLVLRYQFDLACIVLQSGDLDGALRLHEDILKARFSIQGRASYFTLQSQYAVGAIYSYLERYDEAENFMKAALSKAEERGGKNFWPDAAVARTKYHVSQILTAKNGGKATEESEILAKEGKDVLSRLLVYDPISGVREEDTGALFDHLQPVFGGRFTGLSLLKYVSRQE